MIIAYRIILIAFMITVIYLIRSIFVKYREQFILTKASEKITDGYLIFTANGKISNFNKAILNAFNLKKKDIKNKNIYDVFTEETFDIDDINKVFEACKKIRESNKKIEFDVNNKNNNKIFKIEIKSIVNNDIFLRYVIICKDVTAAYEVIEKLQNNQDIMANREKFATLGQLISRYSPFFKNSNFFPFWTNWRNK